MIGPERMMWASKKATRKDPHLLLPTLAGLACLSSANSFVIRNLWPGHDERRTTASNLDKARAQMREAGSVPPAMRGPPVWRRAWFRRKGPQERRRQCEVLHVKGCRLPSGARIPETTATEDGRLKYLGADCRRQTPDSVLRRAVLRTLSSVRCPPYAILRTPDRPGKSRSSGTGPSPDRLEAISRSGTKWITRRIASFGPHEAEAGSDERPGDGAREPVLRRGDYAPARSDWKGTGY